MFRNLCAVICSALASSLFAALSIEEFSGTPIDRYSPAIEVSFSSLSGSGELLASKVKSLRDEGFGTLVLTSIPPGSNSWKLVSEVAGYCNKNSMKMGCEFFPQNKQTALLLRLYSTNRFINASEYTLEKKRSDPASSNSFPVARILLPLDQNNKGVIQHCVIVGYEPLPREGRWRELVFYAQPVQPLTVDYLDRAVFESSVNKFLLNGQLHLKNNYGTVLDWVEFPSLENRELVWSGNITNWFLENCSFDLLRYLPVAAGFDPQGPVYSETMRQHYKRGMNKLWKESFAENVHSLVQEAGLHASISVDRFPLVPEEMGRYFQVPLINGTTNTVQRIRNRRACGGARLYDCRSVVGLVNSSSNDIERIVDSLLMDGAGQVQFSKKIEGFADKSRFASPAALYKYISRCRLIQQNTEPATGFLLCSADFLPAFNRFSFDSVTLAMLREAVVENGRVIFPSGRSSTAVVLSDIALKTGETLVRKLKSSGVKVFSFEEAAKLPPEFTWSSDVDGLSFRFVHSVDLQHDYYLVKNESSAGGMVNFELRMGAYIRISRWQPVDGKIYEIRNCRSLDKSRVSVPTPVRPNELFFIVIERSN